MLGRRNEESSVKTMFKTRSDGIKGGRDELKGYTKLKGGELSRVDCVDNFSFGLEAFQHHWHASLAFSGNTASAWLIKQASYMPSTLQ